MRFPLELPFRFEVNHAHIFIKPVIYDRLRAPWRLGAEALSEAKVRGFDQAQTVSLQAWPAVQAIYLEPISLSFNPNGRIDALFRLPRARNYNLIQRFDG